MPEIIEILKCFSELYQKMKLAHF